jgi:diguanylate cyclase (GGDEF)-like protein/PAS domain S-box-containing protein
MDVTSERRARAELRRSEQIYRAIVKHLPNGAVLMIDRELRYLAADGPIIEDLMRTAKISAIVGHTVAEVASAETRDLLIALYHDAFQGVRHHREIAHAGRFYDLHTVPITEAGEISHTLVFLYDVTERKREAEELRWTRDQLVGERALFEATLEHIEDGVALFDAQYRILLANRAYAAMFDLTEDALRGFTRDQFIGHVAPRLDDPGPTIERMVAQPIGTSEEFVIARPRRRVLRRTWESVRMPDEHGFLATWRDITSENALLAEREHQLLVDALTGIPNRRAALGALKVEHSRMRRTGTPLSVALFDIDHFKRVNDEYGHAAGDRVLCQVAMALAGEARVTDTVARWGGEEFLAILPGSLVGARVFCDRTRIAIQNLVCPEAHRITASAGIAEVAPGEDPADAIARADRLLYAAKRTGRNRVMS